MSTDSLKFSVPNFAASLDLGYRYTPFEQVGGKSAGEILKQVDKVLASTNVLLENHKGLLPPEEYAEFKDRYRLYHWQMTDESQEDRANYDELIRQSRILSQLFSNRNTHQQRATKLLRQVEVFQTNVLSASRNAHPPRVLAFEDELEEVNKADNKPPSALESPTSWLSIFRRSRTSPTEVKSESDPAPPSATEAGQGITVSVAHFPQRSTSTESGTKKCYHRAIFFEDDQQYIELEDCKSYSLDGNETYMSKRALEALTELGERLLSQPLSDKPEEVSEISEVSHSSTGSPVEVQAIVRRFRKVRVATE